MSEMSEMRDLRDLRDLKKDEGGGAFTLAPCGRDGTEDGRAEIPVGGKSPRRRSASALNFLPLPEGEWRFGAEGVGVKPKDSIYTPGLLRPPDKGAVSPSTSSGQACERGFPNPPAFGHPPYQGGLGATLPRKGRG
jgi:hypothetical protein